MPTKFALAFLAALALPSIASAAYVLPDPGGRDGWVIDTVTGGLVLRRAGTDVMKVSSSGDITFLGGAGALTCGAASCSVLATDNTAAGIDFGAAGATALIRLDTTNGEEKIVLRGAMSRSPGWVETFGEGASLGLSTLKFDLAAFTGTTAITHYAYTGDGNVFAYAAIGAGQTLDLAASATGLNIAGDQTSTEGYEVFGGIGDASGRPLIPGTDPAFKGCWTIAVGDASGASDLHVGFRKIELAQGTFEAYDEYASIGIEGTANPNTIFILNELDANLDGTGDGTLSTDTTNTWADAASKVVCVLVSAARAVTYTIDGAPPSTTQAFSFTDGIMVIPYLWYLQGADLADTVNVTHSTVTFQ